MENVNLSEDKILLKNENNLKSSDHPVLPDLLGSFAFLPQSDAIRLCISGRQAQGKGWEDSWCICVGAGHTKHLSEGPTAIARF